MSSENTDLDTIVGLLESEDAERRSASAIVLAELAPDDNAALEGLRKACRHKEDARLRKWAAEAIGAIAPKSIVKDLRPLLKDSDPDVKATVKRVLASGRGVTAEDVARMLEGKDDRQRAGAIAVLGAMGDADARGKIIHQLDTTNPKIIEAARDALSPLVEGLDERETNDFVEALRTHVEGLGDNAALAQLLVELFGLAKNEATAGPLVQIACATIDETARTRAVETLRGVPQSKRTLERTYEALLAIVENRNTVGGLVGPTADTLVQMGLPMALEPRVRTLVTSEATPVRRYAIRALGGVDMAPAAKTLADVVANGDATDRKLALDAAATTPNGRTALTKLLAKMTDAEKSRQIANVLKGQAAELMPPTLAFLEEAVIDADPEVAPIIIDLLKHCGGESAGRVNDTLLDRAMKLKKRGQYNDATEVFKRIVQAQDDAEARFQLGVCELKTSRRVLSRGKKSDPCLTTFHRLLDQREFPLLSRLQQEPILGEEELYYLGFSLSEGGDTEQGLGGDILMAIADTDKDTKLCRMAKNKLVTMGWLE